MRAMEVNKILAIKMEFKLEDPGNVQEILCITCVIQPVHQSVEKMISRCAHGSVDPDVDAQRVNIDYLMMTTNASILKIVLRQSMARMMDGNETKLEKFSSQNENVKQSVLFSLNAIKIEN